MNKARRQQIIEEVSRFARPPQLQADEFTIRQYAEKNDLTNNTATTDLENALRAGLVTRRMVTHNGKRKWAYRIAQTDEEPQENPP